MICHIYIYQLMNHINVSKYIYYRLDDVRLAIAHQIQSREEILKAAQPHSASYPKKTNKQTQNIAKYSQLQVFENICFREKDRGFLVLK